MNAGSIKRAIKRSTFGRVLLIPYRCWGASKASTYLFKNWLRVFPWLLKSKEIGNFTYDLTDLCRASLAMFVSEITGLSPIKVRGYLQELATDECLHEHVRRHTISGPLAGISDQELRPGKRTMYYLLVRALKPKVIVEGGVDKGLGSCIIATALMKNAEEGHPGFLYACDIHPDAGMLFKSPYTSVGKLCIGDVMQTIRSLTEPIGLFIQDIMPSLEPALLDALKSCISDRGVALSVWHTGALMRFADETGRGFLVFSEEAKDHWITGATIPVAFPRVRSQLVR